MTLLAPPPAAPDATLRVDRLPPGWTSTGERVSAASPANWESAGSHRGAGATAAVLVFALWFPRVGLLRPRRPRRSVHPQQRAGEAGWLWNHQNTAAGGPTCNEIGVPRDRVTFIHIAHLLGGGDALGQRLLRSPPSSVCAAVGRRPLGRESWRGHGSSSWPDYWAAVQSASTMVSLPNMLVPLCIGLVGWFTALTIDAGSGVASRCPRLLAIMSVGLAYLALNPPLLAITLVWLFVLPLVAAAVTGTGWGGIRRSAVLLLRSAAWALPLAAWWLVPYLVTLKSATAAGTITSDTNASAWSWAQAHGSLDRVLTLVAKWSWPDTKLGDNASTFAGPGWLGLAFVLPIGLLAAPLVARPSRRRARRCGSSSADSSSRSSEKD